MRRRQALLCLLSLFPACRRSPRVAPPAALLSSEAYVWQRRPSPELTESLQRLESATPETPLHFLRAEFSVHRKKDRLVRVPRLSTGSSGAVVRIHGTIARHGWTPERIGTVDRLLLDLAAESPAEIQIDYDCPTSQLAAYAAQLRRWKSLVPGIPLAFTALPSWLRSPDFAALSRSTGLWVLQVHALHVPPSPRQPLEIFSATAARQAVALASSFQVPFRIALPTYGGEACFDAQDKLLDVLSEDFQTPPASTARRLFALADASSIASLVRDWLAAPPAHATGLIWYRLPLASDRRNWTFATWDLVRRGQPVTPDLTLSSSPDSSGSVTVTLANHGKAHGLLPTVSIRHALLGDALASYRLATTADGLTLSPSPSHWPFLAPGESRTIAWFRPVPDETPLLTLSDP